ncbi:hypothetical protein V8G54_006406 [Vigna mungo]|uniref:Integrase catalytic domain-containing protein n=1 Tax=Vigna mungo TaxID=3915 RepID=A0AAQ3S821_VIGMU
MAKEGEKSETEVVKKMSSPYDLSAIDNPGNVITQVQLKGENYEEWTRAVKISLRAPRKWGFIDGTHMEPETDTSKIEDWWTIQSMLIVNGPRIQQLKSELVECKQQGMTMVAYYGKLKILWDELANYEEEEKVHQFLMGLNDKGYGTTRSNVLVTDPLPSLNRVYATMVQEERVRTITRSKEERGMIVGMAVQTETKGKLRNEAKEKSMDMTRAIASRSSVIQTGGEKGQEMKIKVVEEINEQRPSEGKEERLVSISDSKSDTRKPEVARLSTEQWQILTAMLNSHKANATEKMTGKKACDLWIVNSGASNHMTGTLDNLRESRALEGCPVGLPNGEFVLANKEGSIFLDGGLKLKNVLYVPKLNCNLISVSQLIDEARCTDHTLRTLIEVGERKDGLYWYHGQMGHPAYQIVEKIPNMTITRSDKNTTRVCEVCKKSKQSRNKFPLSDSLASNVFDLIHGDLWGPYRTPSSCGASYFLTLVDDCSRAVWIYLLSNKKAVSQTLMNFITLIERQYKKQVKMIRSDNGTEFMCLQQYFHLHGILHQTSCTGTPQQNGRVERKHQHILNVARALRFQGQLPLKFWGECILTASYLINRTPSQILQGKTPYEIVNGNPPTYEHLRVFGCLCYAHNQDRQGDKFASRSRKSVFVGYAAGQKGWKLFDLEREVFWVSRDVKFVENEFLFASLVHKEPSEMELPYVNTGIQNHDGHIVEIEENDPTTETVPTNEFRAVQDKNLELELASQDVPSPTQTSSSTMEHEIHEMPAATSPLGRGHRVRQPSVKLHDYVTNTTIPIK